MEKEKDIIHKVAQRIKEESGATYYVGGYVRDEIMGKETKDKDVEIHRVEETKVVEILSEFGEVKKVGSSFGVYMIRGYEIDITLPREEIEKADDLGVYEDKVNEYVGEYMASRRRDFTMNAILKNVLTGEYVDFHGGIGDIEAEKLRVVGNCTLKEDYLRVFRLAQFKSRFNFSIEEETFKLAKEEGKKSVPRERVNEEFKKAMLRSERPSIFINTLKELGVLKSILPEVEKLIGCEQHKEYHPEGDVYNHTMLVMDEASKLKEEVEEPYPFMLASLFHDIGKPKSNEIIDGKITSHGHEKIGSEMVEEIIKRVLTNDKKVIEYVEVLTNNHMRPRWLFPEGKKKAFRKLAEDGYIKDLFKLVEADTLGRGGATKEDFEKYDKFFKERMESFKLTEEIKPIVTGADFIDRGMKPSKEFKVMKDKAYEMQMDGFSREEILTKLF